MLRLFQSKQRDPVVRDKMHVLDLLQVIKSEIVLWTAGFVLMTLLINVPLLPVILRKTGLSAGKILFLQASHVLMP